MAPCVQEVLKEVLRWYPVTPLAVPHKVMKSDVYKEYYIPADSIIILIAWYISHEKSSSICTPRLTEIDFKKPSSTTTIKRNHGILRGMMHDPVAFAEPDRFYPKRRLSPGVWFRRTVVSCLFLRPREYVSNIVGIPAAF